MKTDLLINILREREGSIFRVWLSRMKKAGYIKQLSMDREDFHKIFSSIISALETYGREPRRSLFVRTGADRPFQWECIAKEARLQCGRGEALDLFLRYFKTLIHCLEKTISDIDQTGEEGTAAFLKLRRISDSVEMNVIADCVSYDKAKANRQAGAIKRHLTQTTSEKILSAIFMSVGEGILLVDEDFEIVKANQRACEIYGLLEQNLIGADVRSLMESTGAKVLTVFFNELIEGQRRNSEIMSLYIDGKEFPATVTVTRCDFDGKRYWPMIVRDNTDQRILEKQLRQEKQQTEEMNLTLKTVMKSIEQDRKDFENKVASKIRATLLPSLKKIDKELEAKIRKSYLALLEEQLLSLTNGFEIELEGGLLKLTKTEIEVCRLVKAGCSSKDICAAMKLSFDTIQTHRKNIRRKLDLNGKKINLHGFLRNRVL